MLVNVHRVNVFNAHVIKIKKTFNWLKDEAVVYFFYNISLTVSLDISLKYQKMPVKSCGCTSGYKPLTLANLSAWFCNLVWAWKSFSYKKCSLNWFQMSIMSFVIPTSLVFRFLLLATFWCILGLWNIVL